MVINIDWIEFIIRGTGGLLAYISLGILFIGIWRGARRQAGRTTGGSGVLLRSGWFYLFASALFFGISYLGWIRLPLTISSAIRGWMLAVGALLYFPGVLFLLWGRLSLGKNYFVSTALGAQLFSDHQLVTSGPYSIVRHPMYTGLILAALGSVLIYLTWTSLLYALFAPFIIVRAWREETALAAEFGEQWQEYCQRVPAFLPRLRRRT